MHAIRTGHDCGECLGSDAEHVGVCVVGSLIPLGGIHVDMDRRILHSIGGRDFTPQPAGRTDLGNLHEIIGADRQADADMRHDGLWREPACFHFLNITDQGGNHITELLGGGGSAIMIDISLHRDAANAGRMQTAIFGESCHLIEAHG